SRTKYLLCISWFLEFGSWFLVLGSWILVLAICFLVVVAGMIRLEGASSRLADALAKKCRAALDHLGLLIQRQLGIHRQGKDALTCPFAGREVPLLVSQVRQTL